MQAVAIVVLCVLSAVVYGIVHDQVTARVCVEYFTIGHPPVFATESPTLLGVGWGTIATWWMGLILGVPLALSARCGRWPKRPARSLVRPIAVLLVIMGILALAAGVVGYFLARSGTIVLLGWLAEHVPPDRHVPFIACLWAHNASYLAGLVGGIILFITTLQWRSRMALIQVARAPAPAET